MGGFAQSTIDGQTCMAIDPAVSQRNLQTEAALAPTLYHETTGSDWGFNSAPGFVTFTSLAAGVAAYDIETRDWYNEVFCQPEIVILTGSVDNNLTEVTLEWGSSATITASEPEITSPDCWDIPKYVYTFTDWSTELAGGPFFEYKIQGTDDGADGHLIIEMQALPSGFSQGTVEDFTVTVGWKISNRRETGSFTFQASVYSDICELQMFTLPATEPITYTVGAPITSFSLPEFEFDMADTCPVAYLFTFDEVLSPVLT